MVVVDILKKLKADLRVGTRELRNLMCDSSHVENIPFSVGISSLGQVYIITGYFQLIVTRHTDVGRPEIPC